MSIIHVLEMKNLIKIQWIKNGDLFQVFMLFVGVMEHGEMLKMVEILYKCFTMEERRQLGKIV